MAPFARQAVQGAKMRKLLFLRLLVSLAPGFPFPYLTGLFFFRRSFTSPRPSRQRANLNKSCSSGDEAFSLFLQRPYFRLRGTRMNLLFFSPTEFGHVFYDLRPRHQSDEDTTHVVAVTLFPLYVLLVILPQCRLRHALSLALNVNRLRNAQRSRLMYDGGFFPR